MSAVDSFTRAGLTFDVADGGPREGAVMVLLHGFPQHGAAWSAVAPRLQAGGLRTLVPDQRGYSPRARPTGRAAYRMRELVGDTVALIEVARAEGSGPVHLVGHDWGAAVAWRTAMARPDLVASLTSVSIPHPGAFQKALVTSSQGLRSWYMAALQVPGLAERTLDPARGKGRARLADLLVRTGQDPVRAARDVAFLAEPGAFTAAASWYRALPLENPRENLAPVEVPTTLVWSDQDSAIARAGVDGTRDFVAAPFRLVVLPGVSHWIPEEAPGEVAAAVLAMAERPGDA